MSTTEIIESFPNMTFAKYQEVQLSRYMNHAHSESAMSSILAQQLSRIVLLSLYEFNKSKFNESLSWFPFRNLQEIGIPNLRFRSDPMAADDFSLLSSFPKLLSKIGDLGWLDSNFDLETCRIELELARFLCNLPSDSDSRSELLKALEQLIEADLSISSLLLNFEAERLSSLDWLPGWIEKILSKKKSRRLLLNVYVQDVQAKLLKEFDGPSLRVVVWSLKQDKRLEDLKDVLDYHFIFHEVFLWGENLDETIECLKKMKVDSLTVNFVNMKSISPESSEKILDVLSEIRCFELLIIKGLEKASSELIWEIHQAVSRNPNIQKLCFDESVKVVDDLKVSFKAAEPLSSSVFTILHLSPSSMLPIRLLHNISPFSLNLMPCLGILASDTVKRDEFIRLTDFLTRIERLRISSMGWGVANST